MNVIKQQRTMAAMQPSYFPWLGFFDQLLRADIFVVRDDVAIGGRSWRNRNRLKAPYAPQWITMPLAKHSDSTPIREVEVSGDVDSHLSRHASLVGLYYREAPYVRDACDVVSAVSAALMPPRSAIWNVACVSVAVVCAYLGVETARTVYASNVMRETTDKSERLLELCRWFVCDRYYAASASRDYLDVGLFTRRGIEVTFQDYQHPFYEQGEPPFLSHMSVLDAIAWLGPNGTRKLLVP